MGIKDIFKNEPNANEGDASNLNRTSRTEEQKNFDPDTLNDPSKTTKSNRASAKLPSGTGIGTSGKAQTASHQLAMEQDVERAKTQGAAGYGTDAAAATGGSLSGTHQAARTSGLSQYSGTDVGKNIHVGPTSPTAPGSLEGQPMGGSRVRESTSTTARQQGTDFSTRRDSLSHGGVLDELHDSGHAKRDVMPSGDTIEDTSQLQPVTHEHIRHFETEEVERLKEHERHIHHVQHHTQPVLASERLPDTHREKVHPVTRIEEQHVNKVADNTLFEGQIYQHRNTVDHSAKERTIVDKGTAITEHVHHHIHHVIQPVIEKEIVDREFTHTKIPILEVTNEAPIVHQSQTHAPIPLEHFVERGGFVTGGISQDEISKKVLQGGECTREVDGVAIDLERELNLDSSKIHHRDEPQQYVTTKVTKRTTVEGMPNVQAPTVHN